MSRLNGRIAALSRKLPRPEPPWRYEIAWPDAEGPGIPLPDPPEGTIQLRWTDDLYRDDSPEGRPR